MTPNAQINFDDFYRQHIDQAWSLAWRLTGGDSAAVDDIVQEAFVKAFRHLDTFRGQAQIKTWFHRIVVNETNNYYRRRRWWRLLRSEKEEQSAQVKLEVLAPPGDPHLRRAIGDSLKALSRGQREAFVLVHLEEFTVEETAQIMEVSAGTVKQHLHRAIIHLRKKLTAIGGQEQEP